MESEMLRARRRALQAEGTASAKALRQDPTWHAGEQEQENRVAGAQGARKEGGR